MQRRDNLAHLILVIVVVLGLTSLMVAVDAQARIAFMSDRDWNWEIYVMDDDGGNQRNLTNNPGDDKYPSWSPDGKRITFTADRNDRDWNRQIYVMDDDGGNQLNLSNNDFDDRGPSWSPDGKRIAFVSTRDRASEIYVMDADGGKPKNLTNNRTPDDNPSWSPDGRRIVFDSFRDGASEIYVMDATMGIISETSLTISMMTGIPHGPRTVGALPSCPLGMGPVKST